MKNFFALSVLIILLVASSGCIQAEQPATESDYIEPIDIEEPEEVEEIEEPEEVVEEDIVVDSTLEFGDWCDPTDLNIFVDPYIPIDKVLIFVNENYDYEFGPDEISKSFIGDNVIGYVEPTIPENMKYSNLVFETRFTNQDDFSIVEKFAESDLSKYGSTYYQHSEEYLIKNEGNLSFEVKISYNTNDKGFQTQCEQYTIPVEADSLTDVSDLIDFNTMDYSRSRIFQMSGNFTEDLYDELSRNFEATFLAENIEDSEIKVEVPLEDMNKVVCVANSCAFKSEVNIPRKDLNDFTSYEQWCGDDFRRSFRFDRGSAQPFYASIPVDITSLMCNKLTTGG